MDGAPGRKLDTVEEKERNWTTSHEKNAGTWKSASGIQEKIPPSKPEELNKAAKR